jgi:hypothetical protein
MPSRNPPPYNPADWFWLSNSGKYYSSKRNALVYPYDPYLLAFINVHGGVGPWPVDEKGNQTSASMAAALALYGIIQTPPSP